MPETVAIDSLFVHVTKACNLRCAYCYFSADHPMPDEMSTEEFSRLWRDVATLRPRKLVWTGGEPLLRRDLLDLLLGLREADPARRVRTCLNTNGLRVTPEVARALVGRVDEVRVSVDAMEARNDALRGAGAFRAAVRALEVLHAVGFEPKALVTVTAATLPDLEDLVAFLVSKRITRINVNPVRAVGRARGRPEWGVAPAAVAQALHRAWSRARPGEERPTALVEGEQTSCGVGRFLNVMPNGDVFPCHVLTDRAFRCGNVREESLVRICERHGLLGRLSRLDFRRLASADPRLADLTRLHACMGSAYAAAPDSPTWAAHAGLPAPPVARRAR